jgi:hypothetical protein
MDVPIPCICPGTPHEGDSVTLRDTLDFVNTAAARSTVRFAIRDAKEAGEEGIEPADMLAILTEQYVLRGVASWTCIGADDKPLPCSKANLSAVLLTNDEAATIVADAADDLYAAKVMLPLLKGVSISSPDGQTSESTSPTTGTNTPRPSSPSSISTIPTAATAKTSSARDGASKSSPKSVSAA